MMKFAFFFCLLFLVSCSGSEEPKTDEKDSKSVSNESLDSEMLAIDAEIEIKGQMATSMRYTKENGAYVVVNAHLNEAGKIVKIEEDFHDGGDQNYGKKYYYFKDEKMFASKEFFSDMKAKPAKFVDRITYYDKNEKAINSIEKRVDYEEDLEFANYVSCPTQAISFKRAKQVLDQEGEYKTTFQGFVRVQALNYMVLGSSDPNGFTTTVRVDYDDQFITTLLKNQKQFLNQELFINFKNVIDETGFQYQSYISGEFVKS